MHPFEKLGYQRSHEYIDDAYLTIDLNWEGDVRIFNWFERGVDKCLVKVEHECFPTAL